MHASVRTFAVLGGHVRLVAPRVTRGSRRGADAQGWARVGGSGGESAGCCCHSLRCTRGSLTREPSVGCPAARDRGGPGRRRGRLVCVLSCGAAGGAGGRPWVGRQAGREDMLQGLRTGPAAPPSSRSGRCPASTGGAGHHAPLALGEESPQLPVASPGASCFPKSKGPRAWGSCRDLMT